MLGAAYPGLCGDEQSPIVRGRFHPCLALLPAGVAWPSALLQTPVVSYTTFSPSPPPEGGGCLFLWPIPAGSRLSAASPSRVLSDAVLYGVRTFLDPDNAGPRLPDQPESIASYTLHEGESTFEQEGIKVGWEKPAPQRSSVCSSWSLWLNL